mmetsp:Transcript_18671/g.60890  ORF Transcript_18671/g.60890 Transcript_18671/m.60890 type:complete len:90 (-) Transcript_18671:450-719(-)
MDQRPQSIKEILRGYPLRKKESTETRTPWNSGEAKAAEVEWLTAEARKGLAASSAATGARSDLMAEAPGRRLKLGATGLVGCPCQRVPS